MACPTVDLSIEALTAEAPFLFTPLVQPLSCISGCLGLTGRHRMLAVEARVINRGSSDLLIGAPGSPGVRVSPGTVTGPLGEVSCPEYSYAEDLVRFELLSSTGEAYSRIDARLSPGCIDGPVGSFGCGFLGLVRSVYSTAFGCVDMPLDGVPPGDYTLRLAVDPNDRVAESDESNNTFDLGVSLARLDVLSECPPITAGSDPIRLDCGWAPALAEACTPGEVVSLGCATCDGDPILRACAGTEACTFLDAIASNDDRNREARILCPKVTFTCPAEGFYSSFLKDYPGTAGACSVTREAASAPAG